MASLPVPFRRQRSKPAQAIDTIVKAWGALKLAATAQRAAKKGKEAAGKPAARAVVVVPVVVGGGAIAFRKLRRRKADDGTSVGPVAHASTVSPPPTPATGTQPVGPRAAT
jgi:hypothetical protein